MYILEHSTKFHDFALWLIAGFVTLKAGLENFTSLNVCQLSHGMAGCFPALSVPVNGNTEALIITNITTLWVNTEPVIPTHSMQAHHNHFGLFSRTDSTSCRDSEDTFNHSDFVDSDYTSSYIDSLISALHNIMLFWWSMIQMLFWIMSAALLLTKPLLPFTTVARLVHRQCKVDLKHAVQDAKDWEVKFNTSHDQSLLLLDLLQSDANASTISRLPLTISGSTNDAATQCLLNDTNKDHAAQYLDNIQRISSGSDQARQAAEEEIKELTLRLATVENSSRKQAQIVQELHEEATRLKDDLKISTYDASKADDLAIENRRLRRLHKSCDTDLEKARSSTNYHIERMAVEKTLRTSAETKVEESAHKLQVSESQIQTILNEKQKTIGALQVLQRQFDELERQKTDIISASEALQGRIDNLERQKIIALRASQEQLDLVLGQKDDATTQLQCLQRDVQALQAEKETVKDSPNASKELVDILIAKKSNADSIAQDLKEQLSELQREKDDAVSAAHVSSSQMIELEREKLSLASAAEALKNQISELEWERLATASAAQAMQKQQNESEYKNEASANTIHVLQERVVALEREKEVVISSANAFQKQISALQLEKVNAANMEQALKQQFERLHAEKAFESGVNVELNHQVSYSQSQNLELSNSLEQLQNRVQVLESAQRDAFRANQNLQQQIEALEAEKALALDSATQWQNQSHTQEAEKEAVLNAAKVETEQLRNDIARIETEATQLRRQNEQHEDAKKYMHHIRGAPSVTPTPIAPSCPFSTSSKSPLGHSGSTFGPSPPFIPPPSFYTIYKPPGHQESPKTAPISPLAPPILSTPAIPSSKLPPGHFTSKFGPHPYVPSSSSSPFNKSFTSSARPNTGAFPRFGPPAFTAPKRGPDQSLSPKRSSRETSRDVNNSEDESDEDENEGKDPNAQMINDSLARQNSGKPDDAKKPLPYKPIYLGQAKSNSGFHKVGGEMYEKMGVDDLTKSEQAQVERQMARMNELHAARQQSMQHDLPKAPKMPPTSRQEQKKRAIDHNEEDKRS